MRSNPADYQLVAPGKLDAVVALLSEAPGVWLPIAGGTDLMVQYAAGKLTARKLVSIGSVPELRGIEMTAAEIMIGAGCTFTDIRDHPGIQREFPLLVAAAAWTGGIANQNRGTLGGNLVNASPAADSLPALLAYEAQLILASVRGQRRVSYAGFHTGYKTMNLAPDELVQTVCLPRMFSRHLHYSRKVGARQAQAISKVCVAGLGRLSRGVVENIRIALGSVAPIPVRLTALERTVAGQPISPALVREAKQLTQAAIRPIDDIRSTANYRAAVAGNLVAEFLEQLRDCEPPEDGVPLE